MSELFDREVSINVAGLQLASRGLKGEQKPGLRVTFRVEKTLKKDPNTAEIVVWNLSADSRASVQDEGLLTEIEAGYFGNTSLIFKGELDYGQSTREGPDWITRLETQDGGAQYRSSRINISFDASTLLQDAMRTAAGALGVGLGNLEQALGEGLPRESATQYVKGLVLSGKASKQFDKVCKRAGFDWSIQDGQLQLTRPGQVVNPAEAIVLMPGTGLIGSPERGEKGIVKARSLLQPDLMPGKKVQIRAGEQNGLWEVDGFYRVEKSIFTGDTGGSDWYVDVEAKPL